MHLGSGPTSTTLSNTAPTFARLTVTKQNREQPPCTPCRRHASRRSKTLLSLHFLTLICCVHEVLLPPPPALSGHPTNNHRFGKLSPLPDHNHGAATTAAHTTASQRVDYLPCAATCTHRSSATNTRVHLRTSAIFGLLASYLQVCKLSPRTVKRNCWACIADGKRGTPTNCNLNSQPNQPPGTASQRLPRSPPW